MNIKNLLGVFDSQLGLNDKTNKEIKESIVSKNINGLYKVESDEPYLNDLGLGKDNSIFYYKIVPINFKDDKHRDLPYIQITGTINMEDFDCSISETEPNWVPYGDRDVIETPAGYELDELNYTGDFYNKDKFNAKVEYFSNEDEEISLEEYKKLLGISDSDFDLAMKDIENDIRQFVSEYFCDKYPEEFIEYELGRKDDYWESFNKNCNESKNEKVSFMKLLDNKEAREIIDEIEYLDGEDEPVDIEYRNNLIKKLKDEYGYDYLDESYDEDDYDDFELSGIFGGDLTFCPECGKRLEYNEEGDHICPRCNASAHSLAMKARKRRTKNK